MPPHLLYDTVRGGWGFEVSSSTTCPHRLRVTTIRGGYRRHELG